MLKKKRKVKKKKKKKVLFFFSFKKKCSKQKKDLENLDSKINKYNYLPLFEKLTLFDERNNKELKKRPSKNNQGDDMTKKTLIPFITSSLLQNKVALDRSSFIPKSATSQKILGIKINFILNQKLMLNFIKGNNYTLKSRENFHVKDGLANTFSNFREKRAKKTIDSKDKERNLFLYFSSNSFFKNNHYVNTLVNGRFFSAQK